MSRHEVAVRNAADPDQVHAAARKDQQSARGRHEVLRAQLDSYVGRRFVWDELERHQLFHRVTLWQHEAVYEFLGRRESGLELWWEVKQYFPTQLLLMQQEALQREQRDEHERQAVHTPRAGG